MSNTTRKTTASTSKAKNRPKRTKTDGRRDVLTVKLPEGLVGRWVNDNKQGRNIEWFLDRGWEFLTNDGLVVGNMPEAKNREPGAAVSRMVGNDGTIGYLMVIDKDLYEEYQAEKQERVDETERAMREDLKKDLKYGNLDMKVEY